MQNLSFRSFLVLAIAGIAVAFYHSYDEITHFEGVGSGACNINSLLSCQSVFDFNQGRLDGIPMYAFGLVWFPLILVIAIVMRPSINGVIMFPLLMVGNLFTIYLWYLEIAIIQHYCPVCIALYAINYIMSAIALKTVY